MKKLIITALTLIFAVSCNVKELQSDYIKAPIFYGQIENEPLSKTGLSVDSDGVGTILWKPSDNINVFFGTKSVKYTSNNIEEAINVFFETKDVITDVDAASNNNWGLYPYNSGAECDGLSVTTTIPNVQKCADNTFGTDLFPMIAHTTSNDFHFFNICGGIKFSLSRGDIKSIIFKGNNDEDIAGKVKVSINDDGKPETSIISGEKQITITPESGTTFKQNTNYYIVILPIVLSKGFTMIFETDAHVGIFKYEGNPVAIKRSVFSVKDQIDTYASFKLSDNVVDMGLSVLWASSNIGAAKPEEYGDYYAWGEIESKSNYDWSTYKWCKGTSATLTKYNYNTSNGIVDNNYSLDTDDDVAHMKLGGKWRIPTKEDFDELLENCTYQWITQNDVYGLSMTSKINGMTIFLPAAGDYVGMNNSNIGSVGDYWTSSIDLENSKYAYRPVFDSGGVNGGYGGRHIGRPIRPVYGNIIEATSISLDKTSLSLYTGDVVQLTANLSPSNCAEKGLVWNSSNTSIATVSPSGQVTAILKGSTTISVSAVDNPDVSATCIVEVTPTYYDLSSNETANCYIVNKEGYYKIKATVKGNSTKSVGVPVCAKVLWETFGTSITPSKGDVINNEVVFDDGYVLFSTPQTLKNGNAVIAVMDAQNNILWSWHIWVCKNYSPTKGNQQQYYHSAGVMMDRNLGATSATKGDVHALGLLYQWGRKDPFLNSKQIEYDSITSSWEMEASSTIAWSSAIVSEHLSSNTTLSYSISHPTTFLYAYSSQYSDWYCTSTDYADMRLWSENKTMYDPCPPGWRVPKGSDYGVWATALDWHYGAEGEFDQTNKGMDFGSSNGLDGAVAWRQHFGGSSVIWYPAAGIRDGTSSDMRKMVGENGYYWSCSFMGGAQSYALTIRYGGFNPCGYERRVHACSVRCVAE